MKRPKLLILLSTVFLFYCVVKSNPVINAPSEAIGLFPFVSPLYQKIGYINIQGEEVITPQFDKSCDNPRAQNCLVDSIADANFSEGLAKVKLKRLYGYIDEQGKIKIEPQFEGSGAFSCGLAWILKQGKYGYINTSGRIVIEPGFEKADDFSEGLGRVMLNGKYGYIDREGKFAIDPQFSDAGNFSSGLAWIKVENKYGYIDRSLKTIISPIYDKAGDFSEGLARVQAGSKYGYIYRSGDYAIKPKYGEAEDFSDGLALVRDNYNDPYYYIDKTGTTVLTISTGSPHSFKDGMALVDLGSEVLDRKTLPGERPRDGGRPGIVSGNGCYPYYTEKELLKFGYINKKGEFIYKGSAFIIHSCLPQLGPSSVEYYYEPSLVPVSITTVPASATLYMVTKYDWTHVPNISKQLKKTGNTPYSQNIIPDKYMIILEYNGKRYPEEEHDFEGSLNNNVCIPLTNESKCP